MSPIMSMTGFGRGDASNHLGCFEMEIKSVNHRFLESRVHLPRQIQMNFLEPALNRLLKTKFQRGKVDVSVRWSPSPEAQARARFNRDLIREYSEELEEVAKNCGRPDEKVSLEYILSLPGVSETDIPELDETELQNLAGAALGEAMDHLLEERRREGGALESELRQRLENIAELREKVLERREQVLENYRERLMKKAEEWARDTSIQIEPGRLESEIMMYADRSDITEELVRLQAHIEAFLKALDSPEDEAQGKPLDFLTQELLRETNTIASKSRDTDLASSVLVMKNEIEKIREQILNVE
ncbi:MAG: YicC/YloC family endoribonuclease [Candidatus Sumerlaeia bacterium]